MLEWMAGRWQLALDYSAAAIDLGAQTQHPHNPAWVGTAGALIEVDSARRSRLVLRSRKGSRTVNPARQRAFHSRHPSRRAGSPRASRAGLEEPPTICLTYLNGFSAKGLNDPTTPSLGGCDRDAGLCWASSRGARSYSRALRSSRAAAREPAWQWKVSLRAPAACSFAAEGDLGIGVRDPRAFARRTGPRSPWPLERGRTLLCLGVVRRQAQQKKAAREALEQALAIFEDLGARLWAEKARGELRPDQRTPAGLRRAHRDRAARRRAAVAGPDQTRRLPPDLFMGREHGRDAPLACVRGSWGVRRAGLAARLRHREKKKEVSSTMPAEVIGRDQESRRYRGVPGRGRAGPGGTGPLRRGRDRQDDPLGGWSRGGQGAVRPSSRLPWRRG